jgi:hypothetical protein
MARKTDEERLLDLEKKIEQTKAKKQQIANRLREKKRKERTRRLIQVGAIFEKYLGYKDEEDGLTPEKAEQIAMALSSYVRENKDKLEKIDIEKSKENRKIIYKETDH